MAEPPIGRNALAPPAICSACGSTNEPLTRWPVLLVLGSATDSVASPAEEITVAVVDAVYSRATPGVNAPNEAGGAERQRERRRHRADDVAVAAGDLRRTFSASSLGVSTRPAASVERTRSVCSPNGASNGAV